MVMLLLLFGSCSLPHGQAARKDPCILVLESFNCFVGGVYQLWCNEIFKLLKVAVFQRLIHRYKCIGNRSTLVVVGFRQFPV